MCLVIFSLNDPIDGHQIKRWQASWWMIPAWPVTLLVSLWFMFIAPLLSGPFLLVDRFELKGVANQVSTDRLTDYKKG